MNSPALQERRLELQVDRAVFGLSGAEDRELRQVLNGLGDAVDADDGIAFELAAATLAAAWAEHEPMPSDVRDRVRARLAVEPVLTISQRTPDALTRHEGARRGNLRLIGTWGGWAAAAVLAVAAGVQWWGGSQNSAAGDAAAGVVAVAKRQALVAGGATPLSWAAWESQTGQSGPSEIAGVTGDVVWSPSNGEGYMRFVGLPPNDPAKEQYQLWIVDAELGLSQRISGGVFDVPTSDEVVVPIRPALGFTQPVAFAVTIERPGGVWVSDMSRRVVIAFAQ
ncbi:MAG: anti-sigma factor [Phycisphaeraceae bacterium]|nr:anti-sigma factor [Phycisphaeraceae bacterium]